MSRCLLCHIFAKTGPEASLYSWATFTASYMDHFKLTPTWAGAYCATCLPKPGRICFKRTGPHLLQHMWATLDTNPHEPVLTVPYLCQNWPRHLCKELGHICCNMWGPHLVYSKIRPCLLCSIFAKGGPYLLFDIWAIFTIWRMGHFWFIFRWHVAMGTASLP